MPPKRSASSPMAGRIQLARRAANNPADALRILTVPSHAGAEAPAEPPDAPKHFQGCWKGKGEAAAVLVPLLATSSLAPEPPDSCLRLPAWLAVKPCQPTESPFQGLMAVEAAGDRIFTPHLSFLLEQG